MTKEKYCDLHVHSNCSDGSEAPEDIINIAAAAGLSAVALTDHNTVAGLDRFETAAVNSEVIPVPGAEITVGFEGRELHLLGLFIDRAARPAVTDFLSEMAARKRRANEDMMARLAAAGYRIDYADVLAAAGEALPNRVHVAKVLIERGYLTSVDAAFQTLLSEERGFYRPAQRLDVFEVIDFLRGIKALPILAHPFLNLTLAELERFLPAAKTAGLAGMEVRYADFTPRETALAAELADSYGLLCAGGSDFHGKNRPRIVMGWGEGDLCVPFSYFERLKTAKETL